MLMTREEAVRMYEEDIDFPGRGFSASQAEAFYTICADYLRDQEPIHIKTLMERALREYGDAANEAMYTFVGSSTLQDYLDDYEKTMDTGYAHLDSDWRDGYLIRDVTYLVDNYAGDLEDIWEDDSCWGFWCYLHGYDVSDYSAEALDAVIKMLSGYDSYDSLIRACY